MKNYLPLSSLLILPTCRVYTFLLEYIMLVKVKLLEYIILSIVCIVLLLDNEIYVKYYYLNIVCLYYIPAYISHYLLSLTLYIPTSIIFLLLFYTLSIIFFLSFFPYYNLFYIVYFYIHFSAFCPDFLEKFF